MLCSQNCLLKPLRRAGRRNWKLEHCAVKKNWNLRPSEKLKHCCTGADKSKQTTPSLSNIFHALLSCQPWCVHADRGHKCAFLWTFKCFFISDREGVIAPKTELHAPFSYVCTCMCTTYLLLHALLFTCHRCCRWQPCLKGHAYD